MVYLSIFFLIILAFIFGCYLLKNRSKISDFNNHKNDYYGTDLEPFNLSEDNYYAFEGSCRSSFLTKVNKQEPIKFTIFRDEMGNFHFAITYIESGKYRVGELNNVSYDYSDPKTDQLKFEWLSYNSNSELENNDVLFQRLSSVDNIRFRCVIYEQFEFKSNVHVKQVGYSGYQLC